MAAALLRLQSAAWLPGLCLAPLGRDRHSRGKAACLAHPLHKPSSRKTVVVRAVKESRVEAVEAVDRVRWW